MADEKKQKKAPGLRVRATVEGFRRAGRAWSTEPVDVRVDEFDAAQIKALWAEPRLTVMGIEL